MGFVTTPVGPEDEPFLYRLYASTRQAEVAGWGLSPDQQAVFLRMQFQAQQRSYAQYPGLDHCLIRIDGQPAGRILLSRREAELLLVDVALLPEYQGRGMGSRLIKECQAEAARSGKPMRLSVLRMNEGARRLYERLGFTITGETELYYSMGWHP